MKDNIITMNRYTKEQLDIAIKDNLKRDYILIKRWEEPVISRRGLKLRMKYCAQMQKVE